MSGENSPSDDAATNHRKQVDGEICWRGLTSDVLNYGSEAIYKPLEQEDSIRLLFLEACSMANDPITCTITHSRLEDRPNYYALSYEWGL